MNSSTYHFNSINNLLYGADAFVPCTSKPHLELFKICSWTKGYNVAFNLQMDSFLHSNHYLAALLATSLVKSFLVKA